MSSKPLFRKMILAPTVLAVGVLFSCTSNELNEVLEFSDAERLPMRSTIEVTYTFTDSGQVQNTLYAGTINQYQVGDSSYSEITNGLALSFFTGSGEYDGKLTAKNGYISGDNSLMIARDSVVFVNREGETLRTEELFWVQDSSKVFTNKFVTIERGDGVVLYGKGMISNQNFTNYTILEPTGMINISDDDK